MSDEITEAKVTKFSGKQLLRDPDVQLTDQVFTEALGEATAAYRKFVSELPGQDMELEWRYYTDGKAWLGKGLYKWTGTRGGQKEMTVFWMSIWDGFFKVSVFFPEKSRADVLALPLGDDAMQMIADSKLMGKTQKFFPVVFNLRSDEWFEAVFAIAEYKKKMK